jgi:hypothetical protein
MSAIPVSALFEYIQKTDQVTIQISIRVNQGVSDSGLSCQMDNDLRLIIFEKQGGLFLL